MHRERVEKLGSALWRQSLRPYTARARKHEAVFGLDSEFYTNSRGRKRLLCWQLSYGTQAKLYTERLSWENLYKRSLEMLAEAGVSRREITLFVYAVFFGIAEAQWVDWQAGRIQLYAGGRMSVRRPVTRHRDMYLMDISPFFPGKGLREVARSFGLRKLRYDVAHLSQASLKDEKFRRYALNDAAITQLIFEKARAAEMADSGVDILLTRTPGATAAAEFRATYIAEHHGQRDTALRRLALLSDWGGVQQCIYRGYSPQVREYDAVNMFGQTTVNLKILPLESDWRFTADLDEFMRGAGGLAKVMFLFPAETKFPCLPVSANGRIVFPLQGTSHCTLFEIRQALSLRAEIVLLQGYYYTEGVTWFADYIQQLIEKRRAAADSVTNTLLKAKLVSIIGKLSQKIWAYDLNEVKKVAEEEDVSTATVLSTIWDDDTMQRLKRVKVGSLFFPEWHALILGAYRETIWQAAHTTDALMIMTDALFTRSDYGNEFQTNGITFKLKAAGEYLAYKAGLFRLGSSYRYERYNRQAALHLLRGRRLRRVSGKYTLRRLITARQAMHDMGKLGDEYEMSQHVSLGYDNYRVLLPGGETRPLSGIATTA